MIPRTVFMRYLTAKQIEEMLKVCVVTFPVEEKVINEVTAARKFEKGQKNAFMDGIN